MFHLILLRKLPSFLETAQLSSMFSGYIAFPLRSFQTVVPNSLPESGKCSEMVFVQILPSALSCILKPVVMHKGLIRSLNKPYLASVHLTQNQQLSYGAQTLAPTRNNGSPQRHNVYRKWSPQGIINTLSTHTYTPSHKFVFLPIVGCCIDIHSF